MTQRRDFLIGAGSMLGIAAVSPTLIAATHELAVTAEDISQVFPRHTWLALYDSDGHYLTDIKLLRTEEHKSAGEVRQFSQIWKTRNGYQLTAGTYIVDDFTTKPYAMYYEPSNHSKRKNLYRAPFSLLN